MQGAGGTAGWRRESDDVLWKVNFEYESAFAILVP